MSFSVSLVQEMLEKYFARSVYNIHLSCSTLYNKFNVQSNNEGLISHDHAWILPSYYNPNWWRIQDEESLKDYGCSDEEMINILESVIFVNTVKFPPSVRFICHILVISKY